MPRMLGVRRLWGQRITSGGAGGSCGGTVTPGCCSGPVCKNLLVAFDPACAVSLPPWIVYYQSPYLWKGLADGFDIYAHLWCTGPGGLSNWEFGFESPVAGFIPPGWTLDVSISSCSPLYLVFRLSTISTCQCSGVNIPVFLLATVANNGIPCTGASFTLFRDELYASPGGGAGAWVGHFGGGKLIVYCDGGSGALKYAFYWLGGGSATGSMTVASCNPLDASTGLINDNDTVCGGFPFIFKVTPLANAANCKIIVTDIP